MQSEIEIRHIYIIQNQINLKLYVGQTKNPKRRWGRHKRCVLLPDGDEHKQAVHYAMQKYGVENFTYTLIEEHNSKEAANEAEIFWIEYFHSMRKNIGYNRSPGGIKSSFSGWKKGEVPEATRKKMSEAQKNSTYVRPSKYAWPDDNELVALINRLGYTGASKYLGIDKMSAIHNRILRNELKPAIKLPKQSYSNNAVELLDWPINSELVNMIKEQGYAIISKQLNCTVKQLYHRINSQKLGPINPNVISKRQGENNSNAMLTAKTVLEIIHLFNTGNYSRRELGRKFKVSKTTIINVIAGKVWSHITGIKPKSSK